MSDDSSTFRAQMRRVTETGSIANFRSLYLTNWPVLMAIAVITTVPMAIFFLVFQRYFIASNISAGIKG